MPPCTITAKSTTRLQNKYHPEWSVNQAVWKSDNQGLEEAAFIQIGRGTEMWRDAGEAQRQEWVVSHPRVVDKNWEVHFLQ